MSTEKSAPPLKPWLNPDGKHKSDFQIKHISGDWDEGTWEEYLSDLETPLQESLLKDPVKIESFIEDYTALLFRLEREEKDSHVKRGVQLALRALTHREYVIVEMNSFRGMNTREIARELGISRFNVRKCITRAHDKIAKFILKKNIQLGIDLSKLAAAHFQPKSSAHVSIGREEKAKTNNLTNRKDHYGT